MRAALAAWMISSRVAPGCAVGNVFGDGAAKEPGILHHQRQTAAQAVPAVTLDRHAVNGDGALLGRIEPQQQTHQCGLASTGGAHHRRQGPRRDMGAEIPQHRLLRIIAEPHMVEADLPPQMPALHRVRAVLRLGGLGDQLQHPLRRGHTGLELSQQIRRLPDGAGEFAGVEHERGQGAQGQPSLQIQQGSEHADGRKRQIVDEVHRRPQGHTGPVRLVVGPGTQTR